MSPAQITKRIKQQASELGFQLCGVCPATSPRGAARLDEWLAAGYGGQMHYIAGRREAYADPGHVLEGVQSLVMLGMVYNGVSDTMPTNGTTGRVARYAQGSVDYHDLIRERLHALADTLRDLVPAATTRGVVDTAPLLEREFAQLAGLGWVGKNTLLLSKHAGSYFFLAALLTDVVLDYDVPFPADHCGTCTACLDACPTDAFPQAYVLDASRCISYLTIELREAVAVELRAAIGDWVFGCDICQEVCPWNRGVPPSTEGSFMPQPELNPLDLPPLFEMVEAEFRQRFRHTPLWRAHRRGLLRSAAIALGNQRDPAALPALAKGLADEEPLVRGAAAWALGKFDLERARDSLLAREELERDESVLAEIRQALERLPREFK